MTKLTKEAQAALAPMHNRHKEIKSERDKHERHLMKLQEKLRKIERRFDPDNHAVALAEVNAVKKEIGRISFDDALHAQAITLISGGTNYFPPPD